MKSPLSTAALGLALAATAACTTPTVVNTTNNFNRATDMEFLCLDVPDVAGTPVRALPLSQCGINPTDNTSTTGTHHLHAVVTQSERGEIAVVDLAAASGTSLIDNTPGIPGYSFIPVGALPTALVADVREGGAPSSLWIASGAEHAIERLNADLVRYNPRVVGDAGPVRSIAAMPMDGTPRDLALDTVGGRTLLYATVPDRSAVVVFDVTDPLHPVEMSTATVSIPPPDAGTDGGTDASDVSDASDAFDDSTDADTDAGADAGTDAGADGGMDGAVDAGPLSGLPTHPVSIAVDPATHRVFVSDDRSNFVHVLSGMPLAETGRIDMGVPTRELAVTGWARRTTCIAEGADPDHYGRAQYLYVTHATSGAVLVYDLTRGARVQANVLPAPNAQRRVLDPSLPNDRVALSAPAVALMPIQTSEYTLANAADGTVRIPDACRTLLGCRGTASLGPTFLHGVFMGVVTRDGRMSFIDIDDYDAPARAASPNVLDSTNGYAFVRHAPRATLQTGFAAIAPVLAAEPALSALLQSAQRAPVMATPTTPTLGCLHSRSIMGCDSQAAAADNFGVELAAHITNPSFATDAGVAQPMPPEPTCGADRDAGTTLVRGAADPYAVRNEAWGLTYESILPGLELYGGALGVDADGMRVTLDAPGSAFCTHGTLADDALARDHVVLRDAVSALAADQTRCQQLFGTADQSLNREFVIDDAFQDRLLLRTPPAVSPQDVPRCFPQATHFEVRAGGQWVVFGSRNAFLPAVTADASNHCMVDEAKQAAVETLAQQCLLTRAPLAARTAALPPWLMPPHRCPAGRACMAPACPATSVCTDTLSTTGVLTAAATPVFANPFFCLQVFPGVGRVEHPVAGMGPAYVPLPPVRNSQFTFVIQGAWERLSVDVGTLPVSSRFLPQFDRFYVVDTQAAGLIEYRSDPLSRTRIFN